MTVQRALFAGRPLRLAALGGLIAAVLFAGAGIACAPARCRSGFGWPAPDLSSVDLAVLAWAADWHSPAGNALFLTVTWLGSLVLLLPLAVCLAAWRWRGGAWQHAALLPLSLLAATAVAHLAKWWFARPRPEGSALIALPADWSYPSAHAMQATAFALALWFCLGPSGRRRVLAWTLVGLVFAVGLSRIYLQVHFPSDVLVGMVAGALCALAMRVALDPVAAPGTCEVRR